MATFKSKYTGIKVEELLDKMADITKFVVKDIYPILADLRAAFPTGNEFAYQVTADENVYIWSEISGDWESLGQLQGEKGADGATGADGKSAYQSAVDVGYAGTEEEFNTILATAQSQIDDLDDEISEVNTSLNDVVSDAEGYGVWTLGVNQSIATTSVTQVILDSETTSSTELFELQVGGSIKVLKDGVYDIKGLINYAGSTSDTIIWCYLYANGANIMAQQLPSVQNAGYSEYVYSNGLATLLAGQTISMSARKTSATARNISATTTKLIVRKVI
jgi:hypothetical protein